MGRKLIGLSVGALLILGSTGIVMADDTFQLVGGLGYRYEVQEEPSEGVVNNQAHLEITAKIKINDNATLNLGSTVANNLNDYTVGHNQDASAWGNTLSIQGNLGKIEYTAGLFGDSPGYGIVVSGCDICGGHLKGLKLGYQVNDKLNLALFSGKTLGLWDAGTATNGGNYDYVQAQYNLSKEYDAHVIGVYHQNRTEDVTYYELGFDTKLADKVKLMAATAESDLDTDNHAYFTQITYGQAAFWAIPHSWETWVAYRETPYNATINGGTYSDFQGGREYNFKGFVVGANYVLTRKVMLTVFHNMGQSCDSGDDYQLTRVQVTYFL